MNFTALVVGAIMATSTEAHSHLISPIEALVEGSGYIAVGKVVRVEILDSDGYEINDLQVWIRPEFSTRLHVLLDRRSVLKGDREKCPQELVVLQKVAWPWLKTPIEHLKKMHEGRRFIFLLNDKNFAPGSASESVRNMSEKETIVKLVKKGPPKREPHSRKFSSGPH